MYLFIAKDLLGKLPFYISNILIFYTDIYYIRSSSHIQLKVLRVLSEFGKCAFQNIKIYLI